MRKILIIILGASSVYCLADNNDAIYDPIQTGFSLSNVKYMKQ